MLTIIGMLIDRHMRHKLEDRRRVEAQIAIIGKYL